jgi:hypothetical protein
LSDWQFDAPEEKHIYLELLSVIRQRLIEAGFYTMPKVAFFKIEAEKQAELEGMVTVLGGNCG